MKTVAVTGGGPAGVYFAIKLFEEAQINNIKIKVKIFDKKKPLLTLLPTGNGRCNLSYGEFDYRELAKNYPRGEKFLYSIFSRYGVKETLIDFEKIGIKTYVQEDNRIFPRSNSAKAMREAMLFALKKYDIEFINEEILSPPLGFDAVILACGLKSGAKLAEKFGHTIIPLKPSLSGLKIREKEFTALQGVSFNGIIFTDVGVSGPYIYKISSINSRKDFPYKIEIPLVDPDELRAEVSKNPKKLFKNVLSNFMPSALAAHISGGLEKQCANVSKKEILSYKTLTLTATGYDGRGEIVHSGGVSLNEVDKNLKSKVAKNLWVIGEVLDIDGFTGGFNLQNCWSGAAVAACDVIKNLKDAN